MFLRSFATLPDLINYLFGTHLPTVPPNMFGLMMGLGFVVGGIILKKELERRENLGYIKAQQKTVRFNQQKAWTTLILNAVIGAFLGLKILGVITQNELFLQHTTNYIFSLKGDILGGLIGAGLSAYFGYKDLKKKQTAPTKVVHVFPSHKVGDIILIGCISGILGSNVFSMLESPADFQYFLRDPINSLFSGLTIYGGLFFGSLSLWLYARSIKLDLRHLFDGMSMAFMLAYAVGRIGCQLSGDGDWGITNTLTKPSFIPSFLWSEKYAHNVGRDGVLIENCTEPFCYELAQGAFPTPLYETIMCTLLFLLLWKLRKQWTAMPGLLFTAFVFMNGAERFLIEKIRINTVFDFLGMQLTQAEIISFSLMLVGSISWVVVWKYYQKNGKVQPLSSSGS